MRAYDLIYKKRQGAELTESEINALVQGFSETSNIADYQMSAFFMAVFFKGMTDAEIFYLTRAMINSGESFDLSSFGTSADKHSTGGVGDGTSLIIAPVVAACGVVVPMMAGRALGHTGGTLDKLEAIKGFNVNQTAENFLNNLKTVGVCLTGQTASLVPADKEMYALRDATATVESIPLITSSIMSKKIAEGAQSLVLDVKWGNGAFMQNYDDALSLAQKMLAIGNRFGRRMSALVTNMNSPLGNCAGNSLEVKQAVEILQGLSPRNSNDLYELSLELSAMMVLSAKKALTLSEAMQLCESKIRSGEALKKFAEIIAAQGGEVLVAENPQKYLPQAKYIEVVKAPAGGFVASLKARDIGIASMILGAGRAKKEDVIDHSAGIVFAKKTGSAVNAGDVLAELHFSDAHKLEAAKNIVLNAYEFSAAKPQAEPLITKRFDL
ncbi:MAG: thymidine phosphorylase [Elusimicrobia bacterium]|nr:thymidine phosphorylase [Elusimicrobiota bacterium]